MLNLFLRPRWDSPKAQQRIQALLAMPEDDTRLQLMAESDSEPQVRAQALRRLHSLAKLLDLAQRDLDAQVRDAAWERALELLMRPLEQTPEKAQRLDFIAAVRPATMLTRIIKSTADLELRRAAVHALNDELHLEDIALNSSLASLRLAAAEKIHSEPLLQTLAEQSRNRDKNVHRLAQQRLDTLLAARRAEEEEQRRRQQVQEQVRQLACAPDHPLYAARAAHLEQTWQDLAMPDAAGDLSLAWERIHARCQELAHAQEQRRVLHQIQATLQNLRATPLQSTQVLHWAESISDLERLIDSLAAPRPDEIVALHASLALWQDWWDIWLQNESRLAVSSDAAERLERIDRLLAAPLPDWIDATDWQQALRQERQQYLPPPPAETTAVPKPSGRPLSERQRAALDKVEALIQQGQSQAAHEQGRRMLRWSSDDSSEQQRLDAVRQTMQGWQDWQAYAVLPKQDELLAAATELSQLDAAPAELHRRLRALRQAWKNLGHLEHPEAGVRHERFRTLTHSVDRRCQDWLRQEAEARKQWCAQFTALVSELSAVSLPPSGDRDAWRTLRQRLPELRAQLRQPADELTREQRSLIAALRIQIQRLTAGVQAEESAQEKRMQSLIEAAQQITQAQELRTLQQAWRQLGIHRHQDNQRLWPQFQSAIAAWREKQASAEEKLLAEVRHLASDDPGFLAQLDALAQAHPGRAPVQSLISQRRQEFLAQRQQRQQRQRADLIAQLINILDQRDAGQAGAALDDLPRPWRQHFAQASLPCSRTERQRALLLWEGLLDIAAPEAERDLQRQLRLERWTRGERRTDAETLQGLAQACMMPCEAATPELHERIAVCLHKTLKP